VTDLCLVLSTAPSPEEGLGIGRRPEIVALPIDSGAQAVRQSVAPGGGEPSL
jgi:hypothetical protein